MEAQVGEKTQRAVAPLEDFYGVSAFLASAQTVEVLANGFAQQVRQFVRAHGVVLRWAALWRACAQRPLKRDAAADDRASLARELHDPIAQSLVFLPIEVKLLRSANRNGEAAVMAPALDGLGLGLHEALKHVPDLLLHFRTLTNNGEIETALRETLSLFVALSRLPTHLVLDGEGLTLPLDVQVQLLHVLQEGLANVRKHAGPCEARLLVDKGARWRPNLSGDGRGFDVSNPNGRPPHRPSDHPRANLAHEAQAKVGFLSHKGTQLRLMLPPCPMTWPPAPAKHPLSGSEFFWSNPFSLRAVSSVPVNRSNCLWSTLTACFAVVCVLC